MFGCLDVASYGCFRKWWVFPPNHPFVHRVFHYFHHPFWGSPSFGNTHIPTPFVNGIVFTEFFWTNQCKFRTTSSFVSRNWKCTNPLQCWRVGTSFEATSWSERETSIWPLLHTWRAQVFYRTRQNERNGWSPFMIGVCSWHVKREPTPTHVPPLNAWITQMINMRGEGHGKMSLGSKLTATTYGFKYLYIQYIYYIHIELGVFNHWFFFSSTWGRHFWLVLCRYVKIKQLATVIFAHNFPGIGRFQLPAPEEKLMVPLAFGCLDVWM